LPPTAFVQQQNRATADTAQEAALAEGLAPLKGWVKRLADHVIQDRLGHPDLEFSPSPDGPPWRSDPGIHERAADPAEQAKLLDLYVKDAIYTVNEARDILGLDPVPGGDQPLIYAAAGPTPLDVRGNNRIADEELTPCCAALAARGNEALRKLTALASDPNPILQLRAAAYGFEADPETSRRVLLDLAKRRDLFAMFAWAALSHHDRQSAPPVSTLLQNIRGSAES